MMQCPGQSQVDNRAAESVWAGAAAVAEQLLGPTPDLLQGVGQDRQRREVAGIIHAQASADTSDVRQPKSNSADRNGLPNTHRTRSHRADSSGAQCSSSGRSSGSPAATPPM